MPDEKKVAAATEEEIPFYEAETDCFIAPHYVKAGLRFHYDGPYGPHLIPKNDAAKARQAAYFKENPGASINPVDALPVKFMPEVRGQLNRAAGVANLTGENTDLGLAALETAKAEPGLTNGGKVQ